MRWGMLLMAALVMAACATAAALSDSEQSDANAEWEPQDRPQAAEEAPADPAAAQEPENDATATEDPQPPASRILAIVAAYKDDVQWLLSFDHGGDNWRWRVPTEIYQVSDISPVDCNPIFPGFDPGAVAPQPGWPGWAQHKMMEKCETAVRKGVIPWSIEDSFNMAAQQAQEAAEAGTAGQLKKRQRLLSSSRALQQEGQRSDTILFAKLSPIPLHITPNRASESLSYLTAIIDHYDHLPDLMLFMHGHQKSWHSFAWGQDFLLERLASLPPRNLSFGFMQLACLELEDKANRVFPTVIGANHWSPGSVGPRWHESFAAHYMQAWIEHLGEAFGQPLPPKYIQAACCASYAVTKEAIRRRPKAFYVGVRDWMMQSPMERYWLGAILEFTWHIMFTNLAVYDPPREQCLCELYDFCTGRAAA